MAEIATSHDLTRTADQDGNDELAEMAVNFQLPAGEPTPVGGGCSIGGIRAGKCFASVTTAEQ